MPVEKLIDILWVLIATAMVLFIQAGFAALESGSTRSKNTINVAIKNLVDLAVIGLLFWGVGFGLMFGLTNYGIVGSSSFFFHDLTDPSKTAFFLFQFVFCGTAATIVSGAIAERMSFSAYIAVTSILSVVIYPVFGHWAWGGAEQGQALGFLNSRGFVDFAGSTVVHSVGGWTALAALIVIGARIGRFGPDGKPQKINPSSVPLMVLGAFILWFGWIGFNGGSTFAMNASVPGIIFNTLIAACAGGVFGLFFSWWRQKVAVCEPLINGVLAGLVAITAGCHAVSPFSAFAIGIIGAAVMLTVDSVMLKFRLDDAVGAIPVHLGAGIWGTLAVGIFGNLEILGTGLTRMEQIGMQFAGIGAAAVWTFPLALLSLKVVSKFMHLRVTPEQEYDGLNVAEHGASTEIMDFFKVLDKQEQTGDLTIRAPVEPFTEVGQIAKKYNLVLDKVENESKNLQKAKKDIDSILRSVSEGLIVVDQKLNLTSDCSKAALAILHTDQLSGRHIEEVLFPYGERNPANVHKKQISNLVATAFGLFLPEQFDDLVANCVKQIRFPVSQDCNEFKLLRLSFSTVVENDEIVKVILVLFDETELSDLRAAVSGSYTQIASSLKHIHSIMTDQENRDGLSSFLDEVCPLITSASDSIASMDLSDVASLFRKIHTIKGGARLFKLDFIQSFAHSAEEKLDYLRQGEGRKLNEEEVRNLVNDMQILKESLLVLKDLGSQGTGAKLDPEREWNGFASTMRKGMQSLAVDLHKSVDLEFTGSFRPSGLDLSVLSTSLIHMLRNSLDHGIEEGKARLASGKSEQALIVVNIEKIDRQIRVVLTDDGRGVDCAKVIARAMQKNLPGSEHASVEDLKSVCSILTASGFSSKDEITDVSGRGVGMNAVKEELVRAGGDLELTKTSNLGTIFTFYWIAKESYLTNQNEKMAA